MKRNIDKSVQTWINSRIAPFARRPTYA